MTYADLFDLGQLTPAEKEVAVLHSWGLSVYGLAEVMGISQATVRTHLHNIYGKLFAYAEQKAFNTGILLASIVIQKGLEHNVDVDKSVVQRFLRVGGCGGL